MQQPGSRRRRCLPLLAALLLVLRASVAFQQLTPRLRTRSQIGAPASQPRAQPPACWRHARARQDGPRPLMLAVENSAGPGEGSPLRGRVALVTGASRGIGRGIAYELALAGATVYATARSTGAGDCTEGELGGTLAELAAEVEKAAGGGKIIPLKCDHARDEEVYAVLAAIGKEAGRLDVLVNNAFQIAALESMTGTAFWEQGAKVWDPLMQVGLRSHYIAACAAAPLLIDTAARQATAQTPTTAPPCIINIGSFGGVSYVFNVAYGVGKAGVDRLAKDVAIELRPNGVASLSLWPGVVMTERMAMIKAKDEAKWTQAMGVGDGYVETPRFAGRAVVALLAAGGDLMARSGTVQIVAELARELGFRDLDGSQPPSIRSLQFLLPNYALKGAFQAAPWLAKFVPDLKLPLQVMGQRPD